MNHPTSRAIYGALALLLGFPAGLPAADETVPANVATTRGEVARATEAVDGAPDTYAGLAVRGPDEALLSSVLVGFDSAARSEWTVLFDGEAALNGEDTHQILYNIEISTDGGNTFESVINEAANFARKKLRFPVGSVKASKVRVRVSLYFAKSGKAAGAMNLYEVALIPSAGDMVTVLPYVATAIGSSHKPDLATDGFPDTAAGLSVNGPKGVAMSVLLFGFHSMDDRPWTLHVDADAATQGKVSVAFHVEASTDGGNTYTSLFQGPGQSARNRYDFELGEGPAAKMRARITLYIVKDDAGAGAMNLYDVYLTGPAD